MIKTFYYFFCLTTLLLGGCNTGRTVKTELYDFKNYNKQYALIAYKGEEENFIVPEEYDGKEIIILGKETIRFRSDNVNIKSITISKNIKIINRDKPHPYINGNFSDVRHPNLQIINVDLNNLYFSSFNGVLYSKDMKQLYEIPYDFQESKYYVHEDVEKNFCKILSILKTQISTLMLIVSWN